MLLQPIDLMQVLYDILHLKLGPIDGPQKVLESFIFAQYVTKAILQQYADGQFRYKTHA